MNDKRAMNRGFGDGMSRAFELAVTPLVFGAIGFGIDALAGTSPVFTIALAVFGVVGMFVRVWIGYDLEMKGHESSSRWSATRTAPAAADAPADLWSTRRRDDAQTEQEQAS